MKKQRIIELAVKMIVAALTAFLTAITTTSCMGRSPGRVRLQQNYIISVKYHNYKPKKISLSCNFNPKTTIYAKKWVVNYELFITFAAI